MSDASSVYYVSASLRQAVLSLSVIVRDRNAALSRAASSVLGAAFGWCRRESVD